MILQSFLNGITLSLIAILIALGLSLVFGIMNIVNLAHGELYMLGGFGAWLFFANSHLNFFLAMIITIIIVAFFGVLLERFLFKRLRGNFLGSMILSAGLILILQTSVFLSLGVGTTELPVPTPPGFEGMINIFGATYSRERLYVGLIAAVLVVMLYLFLRFTKYGKAMRAVAQDENAACLQGINIDMVCSVAMGIGSGMAAAAGCLVASIFTVEPFMGAMPLTKALVVIILGGLGSIPGTIVGGFIVGFIDSFASTFINGSIASIMIFSVLVLVLLVKPSGLFGHAE